MPNGLANEKSLCLFEYQRCLHTLDRMEAELHELIWITMFLLLYEKNGLSSDVVRMVYDPIQAGVFIVTSNGFVICRQTAK